VSTSPIRHALLYSLILISILLSMIAGLHDSIISDKVFVSVPDPLHKSWTFIHFLEEFSSRSIVINYKHNTTSLQQSDAMWLPVATYKKTNQIAITVWRRWVDVISLAWFNVPGHKTSYNNISDDERAILSYAYITHVVVIYIYAGDLGVGKN